MYLLVGPVFVRLRFDQSLVGVTSDASPQLLRLLEVSYRFSSKSRYGYSLSLSLVERAIKS